MCVYIYTDIILTGITQPMRTHTHTRAHELQGTKIHDGIEEEEARDLSQGDEKAMGWWWHKYYKLRNRDWKRAHF